MGSKNMEEEAIKVKFRLNRELLRLLKKEIKKSGNILSKKDYPIYISRLLTYEAIELALGKLQKNKDLLNVNFNMIADLEIREGVNFICEKFEGEESLLKDSILHQVLLREYFYLLEQNLLRS